MMNNKFSRVQFAILSGLLILVIMLLLFWSENERVVQAAVDMEQVMAAVAVERDALQEELQAQREKMAEVERELEELRAAIAVREDTYAQAVSGQGVSMDLTSPSGFSADMLDTAFKHYNATNLAGSGQAFIDAERDTGVNALFLAALAVHESGWGRSSIARDKNNLFGWGAADSNPYGGAASFESMEAGILHVAECLRDLYLTPGGRYYSGETLPDINKYYATDPGWAGKVGAVMSTIARASGWGGGN